MEKKEKLRNYISDIKNKLLSGEMVMPEEVSKKILAIWEVEEPPVPIIEITKALGFRIFEQKYEESTLSGFIAIDNEYQEMFKTDKLISLNKEDNEGHKRFTISHELCHYIFDFNPRIMTSYSNPYITTNAEDPTERQANTFAANLLMPKDIFMKEYEKMQAEGASLYDTIGELSAKFLVSPKAIEKRFEEVGIE